jgi:hypothetical protein
MEDSEKHRLLGGRKDFLMVPLKNPISLKLPGEISHKKLA